MFTSIRSSGTCKVYVDEEVDAGPHCCDLSCVWPDQKEPPLLWDGDQA